MYIAWCITAVWLYLPNLKKWVTRKTTSNEISIQTFEQESLYESLAFLLSRYALRWK